ncbi:MAG: hypothetical protein ACOY3D_00225 [Candidatus Omnitrophota bacterium]
MSSFAKASEDSPSKPCYAKASQGEVGRRVVVLVVGVVIETVEKLPLTPQNRQIPPRRKEFIDEIIFAILRTFCVLAV